MDSTAQFFIWQDYYVLGLPEIDSQHRQIFAIAGQLRSSILSPVPRHAVAALVGDLHAAMEAHFRSEEAIMCDRQYPGLMGHQREHADFLEELARAQNALAEGSIELTPDLLHAYNEWVTRHLCLSDAIMAANFRRAESSAI